MRKFYSYLYNAGRVATICVATIAGAPLATAKENLAPDKAYDAAWEECARQAQTGDAAAQYQLGRMYLEGKDVKADASEAAYWLRKAASNGNADAMVAVGILFKEGRGVLPDDRIAAEYFWRAAENGNAEGAYRYAEMLRDGIGVEKNNSKAYYWFQQAAAQDFKDASTQAASLKKYKQAQNRRPSGKNVPSTKNKNKRKRK